MSQPYELLDFGRGRKLERFGEVLVDRPCPVATRRPVLDDWGHAQLRFDPNAKPKWKRRGQVSTPWRMAWGEVHFQLDVTPAGQVGVFPEQEASWQYIARKLANREQARVLNLFAYTGGSTLAAATAGAEVVHVDAAKPVVQWAKENAKRSGMAEAPIRWIVEDAPKFVRREVKRGNRYDAIIMDPPSYGHGPKKEAWKLSTDLMDLLRDCKQLLTSASRVFPFVVPHARIWPCRIECRIEHLLVRLV